jgi:hypothetical protein
MSNPLSEGNAKAIATLLKSALRSGDVINTSGRVPWYDIPLTIGEYTIRKAQSKLFLNNGSKFDVNPNMDTHSTIYVNRTDLDTFFHTNPSARDNQYFVDVMSDDVNDHDETVFSVQLPYAQIVPLWNECVDDVTVYRWTPYDLHSDTIAVQNMIMAMMAILGKQYDLGQLLAILCNELSGEPNTYDFNGTDFGSPLKVCSVGVACVYSAVVNHLATKGISVPRLFQSITTDATKWPKGFVDTFMRKPQWDLDMTYPACFSNSQSHFRGEFVMVMKVENGKIVYDKGNM